MEFIIQQTVPLCIKKILFESGYDSELCVENLDEGKLIEVEKFIENSRREILEKMTCCFSDVYRTKKPFRFVPGHTILILQLPKVIREYKETVGNLGENQNLECASTLLNELILASKQNFKKPATHHRYSDIIKYFSTYIYMLCGKNCYEILSHNLPIPKTPSICKSFNIHVQTNWLEKFIVIDFLTFICSIVKYIQTNKRLVLEGELRCKELYDYLDKLKAPKCVWPSEDASGIIQKAVFDVKTNQIVGLVLPLVNSTGMPKTHSYVAQTIQDIENFMKKPTSKLVYVVMAQPAQMKSAPFVLQIFGTNNTFTAQNVLDRWNTTIHELKE